MPRTLAALVLALLSAPAFAAGPGIFEATEDATSVEWRVAGGIYSWAVAGTLDGATVVLEGSVDGGEWWAPLSGSALTAPAIETLFMSTLDVRIVVTGSGAATDLTATLRRAPVAGSIFEVGGAGAEALDDLTDVATAGQAAGEALVSNGTTWAPSAAAVCLSSGTNCPTIPANLDDLGDVAVTGQAAGEALVSNGTTWAPSSATVCLSDGTNCPAAAYATEAAGLAASQGANDWLSLAASVISIDVNADATADATIDLSGDRVRFRSPSSRNVSLGSAGGGNSLFFEFGGTEFWLVTNGLLQGQSAGAPMIVQAAGSVGAPNLVPHKSDTDTGVWADGSNTLTLSCGGEACAVLDNDGTNHAVTMTGDTTQAGAILTVEASGGADRFVVDQSGPRVPSYTTVPACGAGQAGMIVLDTDSTPAAGCLCNGDIWITIGAAVDACNE